MVCCEKKITKERATAQFIHQHKGFRVVVQTLKKCSTISDSTKLYSHYNLNNNTGHELPFSSFFLKQ